MSLYWIVPILVGIGVFLLAYQVLDAASDLVGGLVILVRRRFQPLAARRLRDLQVLSDSESQANISQRKATFLGLLQWRPAWMVAAILVALLLFDPLLSPLALTVILIGGELYRSTYRSKRMQKLNEDAGNLIVQFASRYPISRSVTRTLSDSLSALPGGEVRRAIEACLAGLRMNQDMKKVFEPLERLNYPALGRFAQLVTAVQDTNQDVFLATLDVMKGEVEGRLDLHRQARQSLTLVRGTTRVLQAVVLGAAAAASTLPNWRIYFVASAHNWLLYILMLAIVALASLYVEAELRQLEV
jgi:hypothetical protein